MKLSKVLCVFLMLAVVFSLASCGLISKLPFFGGDDKNEKITVTFDSNGGSEVASQVIEKGGTFLAPEEPTKDGYTFVGWFLGEEKWSFGTTTDKDITLVAQWEKLPDPCEHVDKNDDNKCDKCGESFSDGTDVVAPTVYKITYMDGSQKLNLLPNSYTVESTGLVLPAAPDKEHYEFIGWFSDSALTVPATSIDVNLKSDLTFYAGYNPVSYRIDYQLDGGINAETNPANYTVLTLPVTFEAPAKDGFDFKGWYTDANCTAPITEVTLDNIGNLTVYAKWEKTLIPYTVTYLDHEGNELGADIFYESESDQPLRAAYELEGYIFLGWIDADTMTVYTSIPAGTAKNLVLTANMKSNVSVRTLTYYINGEVYTSVYFIIADGVSELLAPNKAGYEFDGWYENEACEGEKVTAIAPETDADISLYAKQTAINYTVKYLDGETELALEPIEYQISNEEIALPAVPEKEGYIIKGWYDAEGNKYTSIAANTTGDLVLYASYEPKTYYITYYLNGGENNAENASEYTHDNFPTLYDPISRDGYIFKGWYTNANCTGYAVDSIADCANRDVTLYAKWEPTSESGGSNLTPEVPF